MVPKPQIKSIQRLQLPGQVLSRYPSAPKGKNQIPAFQLTGCVSISQIYHPSLFQPPVNQPIKMTEWLRSFLQQCVGRWNAFQLTGYSSFFSNFAPRLTGWNRVPSEEVCIDKYCVSSCSVMSFCQYK
jgi:hypothetical protein